MEKVYEGSLTLRDCKPIVEQNRILFPITVVVENTNKYGGDARSFGYPVDEGLCTTVKYEEVRGILAEDTIDAIQSSKNIKPKKPDTREYFHTVDCNKINGENWRDSLLMGVQDEDKESYWCWPASVREKFEMENNRIEAEVKEKGEIVLNFGEHTIYKHNNRLFAVITFWNHGNMMLLEYVDEEACSDTEALEMFSDSIEVFKSAMKEKTALAELIKENLSLLKETI